MVYGAFRSRVNGYLKKAGISPRVVFEYDEEAVQFSAKVPSEGIMFLASPFSSAITVRFGSGHQAVVYA